ncbi:bactofilin family protein [Stakelama pacifica]|uniref:Cytoskeletal protein CcmA (Bactofilin family) n=1 Tax=Stakelama pacifica TaxID=517720 RepID=A0A4R6FHC0_9SPHN|nr:polymer-forming cytoskeletal protein [Stakelama pacifica]TDN80736.1 cytoskeletal protein CcmA (bactofilin family) [Stakelama pacifica]
MFGKNNDSRPAVSQAPAGRRGMFSVLAADLTIRGNIESATELHIEGRVEGDVECSSLTQGKESRIVGNLSVDTARLGGTVEGGVKARQLVVEPSARITGDVEYESIAIETGGQVDGQLKHVSAAEAEKATAPKTGDSGEDNVRFMTKLGEAG